MKLRSAFFGVASLSLGGLLIAFLVGLGKIDLRETVRKVGHADVPSFLVFTFLMAVHILLSTQKWQIIDPVIRRPSDIPVPRSTSFALSSSGIALGQFLPAAAGMAAARTLGTYVRGRAFTRGTVATIFEQGFDFLIICFLIPASIATRVFAGGGMIWTAAAVVMSVTLLLIVSVAVRWLDRIAQRLASTRTILPARLQRGFAELHTSGLLNAKLARELAALSILRFVILVLMAYEATRAIGVEVPIWHLAASMPFVIFSSVIAISPGALGVSELTYATALSLFGTPLPVAAQFALANRFLVAAASFIVASFAAGMLFVQRALTSTKHDAQRLLQPEPGRTTSISP